MIEQKKKEGKQGKKQVYPSSSTNKLDTTSCFLNISSRSTYQLYN
jgi:hypothetical protein